VQIPAAQRGAGSAWLRVPALHQGYARGLSLWKHRVIQGQARVERGRSVNVEALAEAKGRIQTVVEEEFRRTRRGRRRVAGVRYLGVGAAPEPAAGAASATGEEATDAEVRRRLEEAAAAARRVGAGAGVALAQRAGCPRQRHHAPVGIGGRVGADLI